VYRERDRTYPNFLSILFQLNQEIIFDPFNLLYRQDLVYFFCHDLVELREGIERLRESRREGKKVG